MDRPVTAHVWSLVAAAVVLVGVSALWLLWRGGSLGDVGAAEVPFGLLFLTAVWLIVRAVAHGRMSWHVVTVIVAAAALAYGQVAIYCGPFACFAGGDAAMMGWFLVGGAVLIALVHHFVLETATKGGRHAV